MKLLAWAETTLESSLPTSQFHVFCRYSMAYFLGLTLFIFVPDILGQPIAEFLLLNPQYNKLKEKKETKKVANKGVVREIWISVITLKLIRNISESYDAMASKVDVLHRKMYNRQPQVIGKTFENLEIPGKPKLLV